MRAYVIAAETIKDQAMFDEYRNKVATSCGISKLTSMDTKPKELTPAEKKEIAAMIDVQEMWGAESDAEMLELLDNSVYAVKFDFVSGSPGYCGDLFTLHGDALGEPVTVIRDQSGALKVI